MGSGTRSAKAGVAGKSSPDGKAREREAPGPGQSLAEALEQQAATSEILRAISRSPGDAQLVFETIANATLRLCRASSAVVFTFDGKLIHVAALASLTPEGAEALRSAFPRPPSRDTAATRAVLTRRVAAIPDVLLDPEYAIVDPALASGCRSTVSVPLLRVGQPIGAIGVGRPELGPFSDRHIAMLETFADQAVIAIENARLFREIEARNRDISDALEQQTATSEILRVISGSLTDVQPVFDTIAERAVKLCGADVSVVSRVDGDLIRLAALHGVTEEGVETIGRAFPMTLGQQTVTSRSVRSRAIVHVDDVLGEPGYETRAAARAARFRGALGVPMLSEGQVIGVIFVGRERPGLFADKQVELLKIFAEQAVIAVQNVRLFTQLDKRNRDVTEALEQQTATSEILRAISGSPTNVQPVFDIIAERAVKLCGAEVSVVSRVDGAVIRLAAVHGMTRAGVEAVGRVFPMKVSEQTVTSRTVRGRAIVHVDDVLAEPDYVWADVARAGRFRGALGVPMLSEGEVIGAIFVARDQPGLFTDRQVELLKTFADQAVIAVQNVRLFNQLEKRNRDVTEALEQQTATSEILRVISGSPTDVRPVFDIIAERAVKLCNADISVVSRLDGDVIRLAAVHGMTQAGVDAVAGVYPMQRSANTVTARTARSRNVVQVVDVLAEVDYEIKDAARAGGFRGGLGVPMICDDAVIGTIFVGRNRPGSFSDRQIELLKTFADQAVIAVQNVRLFKQLETRTEQLTRSVGELRALGEIGQAVSSTLDLETVLNTIVSRATQLTGMDGGSIYEYDETREEFIQQTSYRLPDVVVDALRDARIRKGEGALGRLALTPEPVQIADIADEASYQSRVREILIKMGWRSLLAVPLLREDRLLGGLVVNRNLPGEFSPEVISLLETFAAQSALAIQNARLFREIEQKSRELEAASRHKSEFLANMSHELRTPLNAIIGFSEVLSERMFGEVNDKQAEYLADILESGRHLLSLINDILDLSKIEAGRMELEASTFSLPAAIENALILVRERAQRRGIKLARTLDERLGMIRADERKVKQVLLNLLSNALKFTPEGGAIDVRALATDGLAQISVTDNGVGIAPQDQEAVFEEFRQVGPQVKKAEGTGLGLAISRKFIELHGGRIWVTSKVGAGSTFTFTLPLQKTSVEDAAVSRPGARTAPEASPASR